MDEAFMAETEPYLVAQDEFYKQESVPGSSSADMARGCCAGQRPKERILPSTILLLLTTSKYKYIPVRVK